MAFNLNYYGLDRFLDFRSAVKSPLIASILIREIFHTIRAINEHGMTVLLVEQNAHITLSIAKLG